jgi:outer membrane protein OmpA-like peptidoglycan-associated protein
MSFSQVVSAHRQQFQASWEGSAWRAESGPRLCALTHEIPRFGYARFEQRGGRRLQFSLHVEQPPVSDHSARVYSEAPPWKHDTGRRELGDFSLSQGKVPLEVPREQALRIYYELEQGMKPVIAFSDWGDGRDQVEVALLPVRFRDALPKFLDCTAGLLYLDFEPVDEKTVYFSTASDRLTRAARLSLEDIARRYRSRSDFRIVLGGHADERGDPGYNLDLSSRRAAMVARYLRSRGVPAGAISSRYFGETRPSDPASTALAWAKNRRVTVWLADAPAPAP